MPCSGCGKSSRGTVAAPRTIETPITAEEIAARMPQKPARRTFDVMDAPRRK